MGSLQSTTPQAEPALQKVLDASPLDVEVLHSKVNVKVLLVEAFAAEIVYAGQATPKLQPWHLLHESAGLHVCTATEPCGLH